MKRMKYLTMLLLLAFLLASGLRASALGSSGAEASVLRENAADAAGARTESGEETLLIGAAESVSPYVLYGFFVALVLAWAVTGGMKRRMQPVQEAKTAQTYSVRDSFELRRYNEIHLGTTVSRTPRNQNRQS